MGSAQETDITLPENERTITATSTHSAASVSKEEKEHTAAGHANYHGIDTRALPMGADEVYEKKISIMNEALIDIGMGSFQWKVVAMTGFGWFVDNVRSFSFLHDNVNKQG